MVRLGNASWFTPHKILFCNPRQKVLGFDLGGLAGKSSGVFKFFSYCHKISWINFPSRQILNYNQHDEIQSRRKTTWIREIRKQISKHFKILLNHITYIVIKFSSAIWHKQQMKFRATTTKVFIPNIATKHVATNTYIRPITTFFYLIS